MLASINFLKNYQVQSNGRTYHTLTRETILVAGRNRRQNLRCHDCGRPIYIRQRYYSGGSGHSLCSLCVSDLAPAEACAIITLFGNNQPFPTRQWHLGQWVFQLDGRYYLPHPDGHVDVFGCLEDIPAAGMALDDQPGAGREP